MWRYLKNWIKDMYTLQQNKRGTTKEKFFNDLTRNEELLTNKFQNIDDIKFRHLKLTNESNQQIDATLVYITNLIDKEIINNNIIKPLLSEDNQNLSLAEKDTETISSKIIDAENIERIDKVNKAVNDILAGKSILLVDQSSHVLSISTQGWEERSVERPITERTVRGPSDGFTENIKTNTGLIRRRIKDKQLKVESFTKGSYTNTQINVLYAEDIVNSKIVAEVKKRLNSINVDQITGPRHIMELIEDNPLSPFDTIYETERPDIATAGMLEGRVTILIDGYPTALVAPMLFMENLVSPEDYYYNFYYTLGARAIRFLGFLVSALLPAIYIAILAFHQEVLPITLVNKIYSAREGVPFPIAIEMIIFGAFFEGIKEAGARIPQALGPSVTIVGALILGEAAINAGLLSPDSVIIGSITGISIFLMPTTEFNNTLLLIRLLFVLGAATSGFFGITLAVLWITMHLTNLRSFGIPFMRPVAPLQLQDLKDFFMRVPYLVMNTRPKSLETEEVNRQNNQPIKRFFFKYDLQEQDTKNEVTDNEN
ncbi:spore germination protein [Acetohalobium arabaticum]|uniref:GerA spore germination protein n=1 Tax=Acetohalobium arabaticum (strain ATCC 49924 / DSM 5501 / Z-7288) TaxID=574087 RepID=D9QSI2_ACEAZ|nr:spore germination protein [Acetohalobium arabaticum]ADL13445.1 GerA spore germination protein [Acetohalobium arabaticum DSM 5501]